VYEGAIFDENRRFYEKVLAGRIDSLLIEEMKHAMDSRTRWVGMSETRMVRYIVIAVAQGYPRWIYALYLVAKWVPHVLKCHYPRYPGHKMALERTNDAETNDEGGPPEERLTTR